MTGCVVVTGAAGVLGSALIGYLSAQGAEVVGIDLASEGPKCRQFIGGVDLTRAEAVQTAINSIDGPIAGLANVAGGFSWQTVQDGSVEVWDRLYRINVLTTVIASKAVLPRLSAGGAIVNVGAAATAKAGAGMGAYTASKSAVARLTEALADEVKARGIRVNAVLPSILDTPANRDSMGDADAAKWVSPIELSGVIRFLLSAEASGITGACIPVLGRM